jgi:hypothetical protein
MCLERREIEPPRYHLASRATSHHAGNPGAVFRSGVPAVANRRRRTVGTADGIPTGRKVARSRQILFQAEGKFPSVGCDPRENRLLWPFPGNPAQISYRSPFPGRRLPRQVRAYHAGAVVECGSGSRSTVRGYSGSEMRHEKDFPIAVSPPRRCTRRITLGAVADPLRYSLGVAHAGPCHVVAVALRDNGPEYGADIVGACHDAADASCLRSPSNHVRARTTASCRRPRTADSLATASRVRDRSDVVAAS